MQSQKERINIYLSLARDAVVVRLTGAVVFSGRIAIRFTRFGMGSDMLDLQMYLQDLNCFQRLLFINFLLYFSNHCLEFLISGLSITGTHSSISFDCQQ